jgi:hypothetical protein
MRDSQGNIIWQQLTRLSVGEARALADKGEIMMASRFTTTHRDLVIKLRNDDQQRGLLAPFEKSATA